MPRRERQPALRAWRLVLVATAAASRTAGTWPPGTSSSNSNKQQPTPTPFFGAAEATAAPSASLQQPRSLTSGRRRGPGRHHRTINDSGSCSGGTNYDQHTKSPQPFAPLWVRARGGAVGKRASGGRLPKEAADEQEGDGLESSSSPSEEEEQGEVGSEDSEEDEVETAEDGQAEGGADSAGAPAPAAAGGPGAAGGGSVLDTLDVKTVLPQAIKTGMFFVLARWLGNKLTPTVESHVRAARAIYTAYLVFSQALCMYIR